MIRRHSACLKRHEGAGCLCIVGVLVSSTMDGFGFSQGHENINQLVFQQMEDRGVVIE